MDYGKLIDIAKQAIIEREWAQEADKLDVIWSGNMMELHRVLLRSIEQDKLFMVMVNDMDNTITCKAYAPVV